MHAPSFKFRRRWIVRLAAAVVATRHHLRRSMLDRWHIRQWYLDVDDARNDHARVVALDVIRKRKPDHVVNVEVIDCHTGRSADDVVGDNVAIVTEYRLDHVDDGLAHQHVPEHLVQLEHPHHRDLAVAPVLGLARGVLEGFIDPVLECRHLYRRQDLRQEDVPVCVERVTVAGYFLLSHRQSFQSVRWLSIWGGPG